MNVLDHMRRAARLYADRTAVICDGEHRSYAGLEERSNRLAQALLALGLTRGERVIVLMQNSIPCIELDFALCKAGLVRVSLNPRVTAAELPFILGDAEPSAIVYGSSFEDLVHGAVAVRPGVRHLVRVEESGAPALHPAVVDYEALIAAGSKEALDPQSAEEDLYLLAYTSGSTGKPKGVMLAHRSVVQVAYNVLLECGPEASGEKALLLQPLSHGAGYYVLACYIRGCTIVIMRQFDARRALELMRELDVETVKLVPTMLQRLVALPNIDAAPFPKLRQIIYGGSHVPTDVLRRAMAIFGSRLIQHYGQTEAPSMLTVLPCHDHTIENLDRGLLISAGRPVTTVGVKVVDDAGNSAPAGEIGELLVRAPHAMSGYWKRDDLTRATLRDGWLRTNDLARLDPRGYVFLLGRKDEMIISGGFNIAPREVEDALCTHPAVNEAAVFGRPDAEWGQAVVAVIALRDATATKQDLIDYTRSVLGYKRPKDIIVLDELPKNPNGKIDKSALKRTLGVA